MGKTKNLKRLGNKIPTPLPLADQITNDEISKPKRNKSTNYKDSDSEEEFINENLGRNIIKESRKQLKEINEEFENEEENEEWPALGTKFRRKRLSKFSDVKFSKTHKLKNSTKSDEDEACEIECDEMQNAVPMNVDKFIKDFEKDLELDGQDVNILEHFSRPAEVSQRRLADIFKDKITEKQTKINTEIDAQSTVASGLKPEVREMCVEIGKILARYRSGPIPKAFKAFPVMNDWEEMLFLTKPDSWSAAAMYQATRLFVSNLCGSMVQRYLNLVVLPRIRDDISFYKRLNYHLYQALCKAVWRPAAFFKGILLPLCIGGDCTLREAIIIGSVIAKNHILMHYSAAAIKKIASMEYSGANSIFLRILFDKKYALPYQVLDEVCEHFKRFERELHDLPVLWHQSLLSFVQRYKNEISPDQKNDILQLINVHSHHKVTPEIRREIVSSINEEEPMSID